MSRRLLTSIYFLAVFLSLLSPGWAQQKGGVSLPGSLSPGAARPGTAFRPGQALVPLRQFPMQGDGKTLPTDIAVRSTEGVTGFGKTGGRVQLGGAGGANVQEQIVNITQNPADEITPYWTSDEQFIYFAANRELGTYQLYRVTPNSQDSSTPVPGVRITNDATSNFLYPTLNANSTRIAFLRSISGGPYHLYVANVPASGFVNLTPAGGLLSLTAGRTTGFIFAEVQRAAWLGTGDIVFSGRLQGQSSFHLFTVNITSGLILQLTDGAASELNPAVSPDARYIAFDANAAAYTGGGTPRDLQNNIPGNPATAAAAAATRNIFTVSGLGANPTQFTNAPGDHVQPSWSSIQTNPRINPNGTDVYIAFASTRRDVRANPTDPASAIVSFTTTDTFDIYYVRALNPITGALVVESAPTGANPPRKLDTTDPGYQFNDENPTWSPFTTILRICHQSDRTGTLRNDAAGLPFVGNFTKTPNLHDLFISTVVDITAPTLLRYDLSQQTGEIVHVNLGTTFNPSTAASVRTPREGLVPGGDVFLTVRVEDRESGMQPEKAAGGRGAVFLVFKNPNSKYQQLSGAEHKEWTGFADLNPVLNGPDSPAGFYINSNTGWQFGYEYEAQAISAADRATYYSHNQSTQTINPADAAARSRAVVYTSSINDRTAFSGVNNPPQDGDTYGATTTPAIWLPLTRLPDAQQDNNGGILYGATWRTPDQAADWYIDVVAYDNAVNPYNLNQRFNWIIYDNMWGFSTAPFGGVNDILVVSDYALGQKFFSSRFGTPSVPSTNNLTPVFYGSESYFTDIAAERNPIVTEPSAAGGTPRPYAQDAAFRVSIQPVGSAFGFRVNGLPNVLGVNSYTDEYNDDGTRIDGRPYPPNGRYEIWRVLSRGPVPIDVLTAYLPQPEQQTPADTRVGETTPRTTRIFNRMVVWNSPFSGDLFVGPGTIIDQSTQTNLTNFVNAGGRLFVSGQDVGFALTFNGGRTSTFFSNILKAQYTGDSGGDAFLTSTIVADRDNSIADEPWNRVNHAYGKDNRPGPPAYNYDPPSNGLAPVTNNVALPDHRGDASRTSAYLSNARLDVIAPTGDAYTQWAYRNGGAGIITSQFASGGKVAYSSLGFESIGYEWFEQNSQISYYARRAEIMHNIDCSFRTGIIIGRITNASQGGRPEPGVLVRAVPTVGAENTAAIATAVTDANGNYQLIGLPPENYVIYAYAAGFSIQHTAGITIHGGSRSQTNLSLTEAPPGAIEGFVFRGDGTTPLSGIEVQLRSQNAAGTISVLRGRSGPDGKYSISSVPVGFYSIVANPANVDAAGNPIPESDPRFNPNYNPAYSTVALTDPANQPEIVVGPGTNIDNGRVEIRSGETARIDFILSAPPQPVTGTVIDKDSRAPIAGATVTAVRNGTTVAGPVTTDANGVYTLPAVPEGSVVILASAIGYQDNSVTIAVGGAGTLTAPTIELTKLPPGSISGLITNVSNNQPVAGVTVKLFISRNGQVDAAPVATVTTTDPVTASDGYVYNYRFDNVGPGTYVVTAERSGFSTDPTQIAVTVSPSVESKNINFRLLPLKIYGAGVQLISVAFDYGGQDPRSIFGLTPGTPDYNAFTVAEWTGTQYNIAPTIPLMLGKGYFVRFNSVASVVVQGATYPNATFPISLVAGWNLIGNPFDPNLGAIDINAATVTDGAGRQYTMAEAVAAGLVRNVLYSYTGSNAGSQYVQETTLRPWFGYWFRAFQPVILTLRQPGRSVFSTAAKTITRQQAEQAVFRSIESKGLSDWRLQIAAKQGDLLDTDNSIGVAPAAKDGFDYQFDNEKPPKISEGASLYVALQNTGLTGRATDFADDIRAAGGTTQSWEFTVEAARDGEVTLFWPNVNRLPRGLQPILVDLATGRRVSMRTGGSSYRFTPSGRAAHRFRIEVKPAVSRPLAFTSITPTRSRGGYRFAFTTTQEADVKAEIRTLTGRSIKQFQTRSRAAEESAINWDGLSADGASLAPGPYMLHLTARDTDGNVAQEKRTVMILR